MWKLIHRNITSHGYESLDQEEVIIQWPTVYIYYLCTCNVALEFSWTKHILTKHIITYYQKRTIYIDNSINAMISNDKLLCLFVPAWHKILYHGTLAVSSYHNRKYHYIKYDKLLVIKSTLSPLHKKPWLVSKNALFVLHTESRIQVALYCIGMGQNGWWVDKRERSLGSS